MWLLRIGADIPLPHVCVVQQGSNLSSALDDHMCLVWNRLFCSAPRAQIPQSLWFEIALSTACGIVSQTWEHICIAGSGGGKKQLQNGCWCTAVYLVFAPRGTASSGMDVISWASGFIALMWRYPLWRAPLSAVLQESNPSSLIRVVLTRQYSSHLISCLPWHAERERASRAKRGLPLKVAPLIPLRGLRGLTEIVSTYGRWHMCTRGTTSPVVYKMLAASQPWLCNLSD